MYINQKLREENLSVINLKIPLTRISIQFHDSQAKKTKQKEAIVTRQVFSGIYLTLYPISSIEDILS